MLTLDDLKKMEPETIFAYGYDHKLGYWVAMRGDIHDWAIYTKKDDSYAGYVGVLGVVKNGDKLYDIERAIQLVGADKEAGEFYRR